MTEAATQGDLLAGLRDLPDNEVQGIMRRINDTAPLERNLRVAFERFNIENPGVYVALVRLVREMKAAGQEHGGIKMLWEVLRWQTLVGDTKARDGYKLNNNHAPFFARLIMDREPELAGFFETRKATADE